MSVKPSVLPALGARPVAVALPARGVEPALGLGRVVRASRPPGQYAQWPFIIGP